MLSWILGLEKALQNYSKYGEWKALNELVLTRDERPTIGSVFDYILWGKDRQPEHLQVDVFKLED